MFGSSRKNTHKMPSAHLLLLSKFRTPNSPDRYEKDEFWAEVLQESPAKAIQRFLSEGMIEPPDLLGMADYSFKAAELKRLLKEQGLKVSGRKGELIQRLLENAPEAIQNATEGLVVYRCTSKGKQLAENYLDDQQQERQTAETRSAELVMQSDFVEAVRLVAQFEASQVFPRGLGINWENYDVQQDAQRLELILQRTPAILQKIPEDQLAELRFAAAMMQLWGKNTARQWLSDNCDTGIHLDCNVAARMLVFHSRHILNVKGYQSASFKNLVIIGAEDACTCSECKKIIGQTFEIDNVPELPYPNCTCESGCRCIAVVADLLE